MNKVCYLLGAGFSAPGGIPTMANFIEKSKDLYFIDKIRYKSFSDVYKYINQLSVIKNFAHTNLHNIEEVLSLIDMLKKVEPRTQPPDFITFITDVIEYYTKKNLVYPVPIPSELDSSLFGRNTVARGYGIFFSSLLGLRVNTINEKINVTERQNRDTAYSVVTLHYDMIPERSLEYFDQPIFDNKELVFSSSLSSYTSTWDTSHLAKLHGSIHNKSIIPPTWSKNYDKQILLNWKIAFNILKDANYIRILGFSLPETDVHIKYILKASLLRNEHLKGIDIINNDKSGYVEEKYRKFFDFPKLRFICYDIANYLGNIASSIEGRFRSLSDISLSSKIIETAHENIFGTGST